MQTVKEESYQAIFRKYYPRMYYYAKRIVGRTLQMMWFRKDFLNYGIAWMHWIQKVRR